MQEKQVTVNGKKVFYRQSGEGSAVVVLVHAHMARVFEHMNIR